ncbi:MAG TPA: LysR family transcriptional regulator [Acetobacteraceae bacterium]|nr:LysR family transcriptional regulator [Acetobacteraceae bacterium]
MRNVTLRQLRVLNAVARNGTVTAAAEALALSPPAVTMQLQQLRDVAGVPLVERSRAGMVLTAAGREVLDCATKIEALLRECTASLAAMAGAEKGSLHVGVISTAKYFAPHALAAFARAHPGIDLALSVGLRDEIIEGLRHYDLDLAVMGRAPEGLEIEASEIGEHPHVIVARHDHPLARRRRLTLADLAGETFLVRERGSGTRGLMERSFAAAGVSPKIGMQIGSNETIKQGVLAGLGITFLSAHTIDAEVASHRLVVLDVQGLPIIRTWYVMHLRERALMPAALLLRDFLTSEGRRYLPRRWHRPGRDADTALTVAPAVT